MKYAPLALIAMAIMAFTPAQAQNASVTEDGQVSLTGQISTISLNSFTIEHGGGSTEVTFENMSAENVSRLEEANIIQPGSYVVVEGKLAEGPLNRAVLEASNIYVQGPQ